MDEAWMRRRVDALARSASEWAWAEYRQLVAAGGTRTVANPAVYTHGERVKINVMHTDFYKWVG